jgi:hypothetical protein
VYREGLNITRSFIEFHGVGDVVVSGLQPLRGLQWAPTSLHKCVFQAPVNSSLPPISQLFYGSAMMVEARWPNVQQLTNVGDASMAKSAWREVGKGSAYGHIVDEGLRVPFSWNGALATLNVAHQWYTWTRVVSNHSAGAGTLDYPQDLPGLAGYDPLLYPKMRGIWDGCNHAKCNQYFLSGKLEALDVAGEWFHDRAESLLYFYPPDCRAPASSATVEVKVREYAFRAADRTAGVRLSGLAFLGSTVRLDNCTDCELANLKFEFPTYDREVREMNAGDAKGDVATTLISGQRIAVRNVTLVQSNNNGIKLSGYNITLDNCRVGYTDWLGTLNYVPLAVDGNQMHVTRCSVHDFGNAGVVTAIPNVPPHGTDQPQEPPDPMEGRMLEVAHCHIYNGARVGEDTAMLYGGGWRAAGVVWHHNWVHDTTEKCLRFDDQSENTTIHHNVVYNCGVEPHVDPSSGTASGFGLVAKGDGHLIYANTIFDTNVSELCLSSCVEKLKPYRRQYPRVVQNAHTQVFNSAARRAVGRCECPADAPAGGNFTAVFTGADLGLANVAEHDYRPTAASQLVDVGAVIPPYTDGFVGKAPDIGAYERGGEWWVAGCIGLGEACIR